MSCADPTVSRSCDSPATIPRHPPPNVSVMNTTSPFLTGRRLTLVAAVAAGIIALGGCSVAVTDPTPAASSSGAGVPAPAETGSASDPVETNDPTDDGSPAPVDEAIRERLNRGVLEASVSQNLTCEGGEFVVGDNADGMIVNVSGDCSRVVVQADAGAVLLPAVSDLVIEGDGAVVVVASADTVTLTSDADINLVGWESGTPVVTDGGVSNVTTPIG